MKRYIFSIDSGQAKLLSDERFKQIWLGYGCQDPGLRYLKVMQFRLDPDDLADIHLFKRPIYRVLYVSVEVTETTYDISVLQDTHPITIAGGLIQPVPGISHVRASLEIKHRIAEKASPLKQILGQAKAKAVEKTIEARDAGGGMDM